MSAYDPVKFLKRHNCQLAPDDRPGWDFAQQGRPHPATLIGLGVLGGEQLFRLAIWRSEPSLDLAGSIVRVLT
jgi:hypothetical protein